MATDQAFDQKNRAELIRIIREKKLMPVSHAARMKKQELIDFIVAALAETSASPAAAPSGNEAAPQPDDRSRREGRAKGKTPKEKKERKPVSRRTEDEEQSDSEEEKNAVSRRTSPLPPEEPLLAEEGSRSRTRRRKKDGSGDEHELRPEQQSLPLSLPVQDEKASSETNETGALPDDGRPELHERSAAEATDAQGERNAIREENEPRSTRRGKKGELSERKKGSRREKAPRLFESKKREKGRAPENEEENAEQHISRVSTDEKSGKQEEPFVKENASSRGREKESVAEKGKANRKQERKVRQDHPEKERIEAEVVRGILEVLPDGFGFLRRENYIQGPNDLYVPPQLIRRLQLRAGDEIEGTVRAQRDSDRYQALSYVHSVNGAPPEEMRVRPHFGRLTPVYPNERYRLETSPKELSTRIIDLVSPIGKGQRAMIVSPPKAGKTILLQKIANAITENNPEAKLIVLLIDERPEEVTDMQRSIKGEVAYSTFDRMQENHVKITELVLERAKRLVELGQDVVILLDSMTRLARAYNLFITPTGRTLSGGLDPGALYGPKRFFGAARKIEGGGSLTIIATSLIETGSRMDEVIFEEFKGTGNMEVILDRKMADKRVFPAIDVVRSGTRREDLLLTRDEMEAIWSIRKAFSSMEAINVTEMIRNLLLKTKNNEHFISTVNMSLKDKSFVEKLKPEQEKEKEEAAVREEGGQGVSSNSRGKLYYRK